MKNDSESRNEETPGAAASEPLRTRKRLRDPAYVAATAEGVAMLMRGGSLASAALATGISETTLRRYLARMGGEGSGYAEGRMHAPSATERIGAMARDALEKALVRADEVIPTASATALPSLIGQTRETASLLLGWRDREAATVSGASHALASLLARPGGASVTVRIDAQPQPTSIDVTPCGDAADGEAE